MLDSKMCPVHGLFLPPLSHIPSLLNHPLVHLRIYAPSRKCFRFSHFSFSLSLRFSVIIQFKGLRIYCLAPGLQVSVSPSVLVSLLFIFSQTRIIPGRYAQIDVRSDTRFVFSGTNPRSLLFLLDQGSPSPISIYSSLGHVNTFIITSIYLFIYLQNNDFTYRKRETYSQVSRNRCHCVLVLDVRTQPDKRGQALRFVF